MVLVASLTLVASPASAAGLTQEGQPSGGGAAADKIQPELVEAFDATDAAEFWVRFEDRADLSQARQLGDWAARGEAVAAALRETAAASQAGVVKALSESGLDYQAFWATNAIYVEGGSEAVAEELAAHSEVEGLYAPVGYELIEPTPAEEQRQIQALEWGIENVKANQVWDQFGVRGEGITVASIDSGALFDHPALVAQYRGNLGDGDFDHNYNWFDAAGRCPDAPCDGNGHGTHTMGTMVGDDGSGNQIGVAPEANWITANGCCPSNTALIASGEWLLEPTDLNGENPDASMRPHIINNSWGTVQPSNDPFMEDILEDWAAAGIFGMWANGNSGPGCETSGSPGSRIINYSAGAYDINNHIASFSGRGPGQDGEVKPNISAPGVNVRSAWNDGGYNTIDGTSMASPHVAGAIALLWSAAPVLVGDPEATKELLDESAIDTEDLQCGGTDEDNNVYGEGRLDALELLQIAPLGETGTLAGTVTDADTEQPIGGATVSVTGEVDREVTTGDDGGYSVVLPVGEYQATAAVFGYEDETAQVTIVEDETTTRDFPLEAVDSVTVSGQITDGSGHGWPMYAEIDVAGTPAGTFTDPVTGRYSMRLPAGDTYTLVVESQYPGYADATETVQVADSDVVRDRELTVDDCIAAPGYEVVGNVAMVTTAPQHGWDDYFLSFGLEADFYTGQQLDELVDQVSGYDVVVYGYNLSSTGRPSQQEFDAFLDATDSAGVGVVFLDHGFTSWNGIRALSNLTGNPESTSSVTGSSFGKQTFYEVTQEHPVLDGFEVGEQVIHEPDLTAWVAWFEGYEGEGRRVIAHAGRTEDGAQGPGIGVQERADNRHVLLSLHSSTSTRRQPAAWSTESEQIFWNAVDWAAPDTSFPPDCVPSEGGLVLGHVTDLNTGDGLNGATVTSVGSPADAATTSQDPGQGDGFYWLFSSLVDSRDFTASAGRYVDDTRTVQVTRSAVNEANFMLPAGQLTVDPTELESTLRLGESTDRTFTITNTGTAPAEVDLVGRDGRFEMLGGDGATHQSGPLVEGPGAEVNRIDVEATLEELSGSFAPSRAGSLPVPSLGQEPTAEPWVDLPNHPVAIADNSVAHVDGRIYSFGGFSSGGGVSSVYVFDIEQDSWSQLADMPGASRQQAAVGVIDDKIYLVSGWGDLDTTTLIYDPASERWSTGADVPAGRSAAGSAVLDGQLYVVGGCTTSGCDPYANDVFRYDPAGDTWETLAEYPEPTAWQSCGAVDGRLYCAGGITGAGTSTRTYEYDPLNNVWQQRANMPFDLWGGAYVGANGRLLIASGVTDNSTVITNEGLVYDPAEDAWEDVPPANNTFLRSGSACGLYKVGGAVPGLFRLIPQQPVELLPGVDECDAGAEVPWLEVDPVTATLAPGEGVTVRLTLDAEVAQPGSYTAAVGIGHRTPYLVDFVDVSMTVTPPNSWGKLTGTVTAVDCEGNESSLSTAIVQIEGGELAVRLATDPDGGYAWWAGVDDNPLTMIVGAVDYQPQTRDKVIIPRRTVEEDFALHAVCPAEGGDQEAPVVDDDETEQVTAVEDETATEDDTAVADSPQEVTDGVTISGQVTDGSGHGWPMYAKIAVEDTQVSTFTDPLTGDFHLQVPAGATYTLQVESHYPGYDDTTETVEVGESDVTLDLELVVGLTGCMSAPGYDVDGQLAMVTTSPQQGWDEYFPRFGLEADFYPGDELDQLVDEVSSYTTIVYGYNSTLGQPTQEEFDAFLDATDAAGVGVVFLDHAFTTWNGIRALSNLTGSPEATSSSTAGSVGQESLYEVTQEHPILDGFEVGQQIIHEPGLSAWLAWFDGYEGDGRQVIADAGRTEDGVLGSGIGVQERDNNYHALLSIHSSTSSRDPDGWSTESEQIFWNALNWVSPGASFECVPLEGGLVLGHATDLNTGAGVNRATVHSVDNPDERGTSFATPDDPNVDDGFYWLFSSLLGSHEFTASADNFVDDTQAVNVVASAANEATFALAAGQLAVDPAEVEATMPLGDSANRTFTITNTGTAPAEVEFTERAGGFDILAVDGPIAMVTTAPDQGFDDYFADLQTEVDFYPGNELDQLVDEVSRYRSVVYGYNSTLGQPTEEEFNAFLDATDAAGVGVVFLDHAFTTWNGIRTLANFTGNPASTSTATGAVDQENMYEVTQVHPILDGFEVGQQIIHEPGQSAWLAWFDGYEGGGRQVIADAGRTGDGVLGSGIGVHDRPTNRHALLSIHSASSTRSPDGWSTESDQIFQNALGWVTEADVPWLSVDPTTASLAPGESATATVSMEAQVEQPGTYTAAANIRHDTPYTVAPVAVAMNVEPPNTWGKITGTVTGVDCDGEESPLAGVTVQVEGKRQTLTFTTDADGGYGWWLPSNNNRLTLIAWAVDNWAQTREASINPRQVVEEDFMLPAVCPTGAGSQKM